MTTRTYSSSEAFKQALEQRLRTSAGNGTTFARKRQLLVFDRFLARIVAVLGDTVTLKGALVLELRIERARTTRFVGTEGSGSEPWQPVATTRNNTTHHGRRPLTSGDNSIAGAMIGLLAATLPSPPSGPIS